MMACAVLSISTPALAQQGAVDCNAVKTTTAPVQLTYSYGSVAGTYQVYRGPAGSTVLWTRTQSPVMTTVTQATGVNGFATQSSLTASNDKLRDSEAWHRYEGIQIESDDRRHSEDYKVHWTRRFKDGTLQQSDQDISYVFKSAETLTVGSCSLTVYRGEMTYTTSGQAVHMFHMHFPELRISISSAVPDVRVEGLSTSFTPIAPLH
jgi:hypothetical protein